MSWLQWINSPAKRSGNVDTGDGNVKSKVNDVTIKKDDLVLDNDDGESSRPWLYDPDGWYRVKRLYQEIARGDASAEAGLVYNSWISSLVGGFLIGGTFAAYPIYQDFKIRFNEFQFDGKTQFARRLMDCTMVGAFRNGIRLAWRASLLTTILTASTATLAVYHDDIRFTDLMLALGVTGGVYRFNQGPKGMFAGFVLFSLFGIPLAIAVKAAFWASGMTYEEFSTRNRALFDSPSIARTKKNQKGEARWREASLILDRDDYKGYLYHQRRVDRLEKIGIVDEDFENIKPTKSL